MNVGGSYFMDVPPPLKGVRGQGALDCEHLFVLDMDPGAGQALVRLTCIVRGAGVDVAHLEQGVCLARLGEGQVRKLSQGASSVKKNNGLLRYRGMP